MKRIKSIRLAALMTAVTLVGCASTQLQTIDGVQQNVFVSVAGNYTKAGANVDEFNSVSRPCQQTALDEQSPKHPGWMVPFNYGVKGRHYDAVLEQTEACLQAAGYTLVRRGKMHTSMASKAE